MRVRKRTALAIAAGATAVVAFLATPATASAPVFCGASRGPTEAYALTAAIWDAQSSAQDLGFVGACTFAEPPLTKQFLNDPLLGNFWRASVNLHCAR